jgi:hypothetical protein
MQYNVLLRAMVRSQSQCVETQELEKLITKQMPSNGHLHVASLTALSWPSDVMSCVMAISSGSTILVFRSWGISSHKDSKVISYAFYFLPNMESRLKSSGDKVSHSSSLGHCRWTVST